MLRECIRDSKIGRSACENFLAWRSRFGAYARFGKKELSLKEITDRIGEHGDDYQILLAHHPGYMKEYLAYGADLILGGHYHGCVVQLPGIGGVISTEFYTVSKVFRGNLPGRRHRQQL